MDKRLICAVAGSGKTTKLLDSVSDDKRYLIVTYTNENLRSLEAGFVKKYGHVPEHIYLASYFSFLYTFCYRPFFFYQLRDNSFTWNFPPRYPLRKKSDILHYMTKNRYLYFNRVSKLILEQGVVPKVIKRIEKYFDCFFIDEIQDFAANDFNFILALSRANIDMLFVGDYHQHTFDTSRDGSTRKNLHKNGLESFLKEFRKVGLEIDTESLSSSYRCSPAVCEFVSTQIGVPIKSHRHDQTKVIVVKDAEHAKKLFQDNNKVKLFYEGHAKYNCYSNNWGKCKGLNKYGDVCVVLNGKSAKLFESGNLQELPDFTRNKLYVACSRARGDLFILDASYLK